MKLRCSCEGNALILQKNCSVFHERIKVKHLSYKTDFTVKHKSFFPFPPWESKQIWMELNVDHPSVTGDTVKWGYTVVVKHHKNHYISWRSPRTNSQFVTGELCEGSPEGLSCSYACCLLTGERKWSFSRGGKASWNSLLVSAQIMLQNWVFRRLLSCITHLEEQCWWHCSY